MKKVHQNKRIKLFLICLLVVTTGFLTACSSTSPPNTYALEETVRNYLTNLQNSNFEEAYNLNVLNYQYPFLAEIRDQYTNKVKDQKDKQPIDRYSINRIAFYDNIAIASLHVVSEKKEYSGFLPLVRAEVDGQERWLIYSLYPVLQSSTPNSLVASASSEQWKATIYLILSDQPDKTGWAHMTAIQLEYTGDNPITKYECKNDIPGFTNGTITGERTLQEALLDPRLAVTDYSSGGSKTHSLEQAKNSLRKGNLTVTWEEGNVTKSEVIRFDNYKTVLWNTSVPTQQ